MPIYKGLFVYYTLTIAELGHYVEKYVYEKKDSEKMNLNIVKEKSLLVHDVSLNVLSVSVDTHVLYTIIFVDLFCGHNL